MLKNSYKFDNLAQSTFEAISLEPCITTFDNSTLPKLLYMPAVEYKIRRLVEHFNKELSWLGLVNKIDRSTYLVEDIFVPEQQADSVTTEVSPQALINMSIRLDNLGLNPDKLLYWGHSHVNMQVIPSVQDDNQVCDFLDGVPFFIREIRNKLGDVKIDLFDTSHNLIYECIDYDLYIKDFDIDKFLEDAKKNIKSKKFK